VSTLWRRHGAPRPRAGDALGPGPILGLSALRATFLDDISAAGWRQIEGGCGWSTGGADELKVGRQAIGRFMTDYNLDDDLDDDVDDDDPDDDVEDDEEDDEEDDDEEDVETWQVFNPSTAFFL
jgi:hypothetical protein